MNKRVGNASRRENSRIEMPSVMVQTLFKVQIWTKTRCAMPLGFSPWLPSTFRFFREVDRSFPPATPPPSRSEFPNVIRVPAWERRQKARAKRAVMPLRCHARRCRGRARGRQAPLRDAPDVFARIGRRERAGGSPTQRSAKAIDILSVSCPDCRPRTTRTHRTGRAPGAPRRS